MQVNNLSILLNGLRYDDMPSVFNDLHVISNVNSKNIDKNILIFSSMDRLSDIIPFVQSKHYKKILKALFIYQNNDLFILNDLRNYKLNHLKNIFINPNADVVKRILNAWRAQAQDCLIATAIYSDDKLKILDCAFNYWEVPFSSISLFEKVSKQERTNFQIDEDGSFLYWPNLDIHLDMRALRFIIDPKYAQKLNNEKILADKHFGEAIAKIRKEEKLTQKQIEGLSERQVRRIEQGARPKLKTLKLLAAAHKMEFNDYLEKIAVVINKDNGKTSKRMPIILKSCEK